MPLHFPKEAKFEDYQSALNHWKHMKKAEQHAWKATHGPGPARLPGRRKKSEKGQVGITDAFRDVAAQLHLGLRVGRTPDRDFGAASSNCPASTPPPPPHALHACPMPIYLIW